MLAFSALVGLFALLQATTIFALKPKPVELQFSCVSVNATGHQDFPSNNVPVILLHGLSGYQDSWSDIFELLALETNKEVCKVDLRNHGSSPWNNDEYDVEAMAEDIKHLIDRLKAPKAIVLGRSLGGKIAVHLALTYPERLEKIIVGDMRPNGMTPAAVEESRSLFKVLRELEVNIPQGVTEVEAKKIFLKLVNEHLGKGKQSFKVEDTRMDIPIRCAEGKCVHKTNPVILDSFLRNVHEIWSESSGTFEGPALFIYGGKSSFKVGDDQINIIKLFPNAKLLEVAEVGHMVHTSEKFLEEVIKFINDK